MILKACFNPSKKGKTASSNKTALDLQQVIFSRNKNP
jgi:hypothetical protein